MGRLSSWSVTLALTVALVCAPVRAAPAAPPPEEGAVTIAEGASGSPLVLVPADQLVVLQPGYEDQRFQRMDRGLRIERMGVIVGSFGVAMSLAGMGRMIRKDGSDGAGLGLFMGGFVVAEITLLMGAAGGLVASSQVRRLGYAEDRRGLAIGALLLSYIPIAGQLAAWALELTHLRKTSDFGRWLRQQNAGPTLSAAPFLDPSTGSVGTGFVLRF